MADATDPRTPGHRKDDTSASSASQAPETRKGAEEPPLYSDTRLIPGGAHGSGADVGMSGMHREDLPSRAMKPEERHNEDAPSGNR